jgi:hypothetical protein
MCLRLKVPGGERFRYERETDTLEGGGSGRKILFVMREFRNGTRVNNASGHP